LRLGRTESSELIEKIFTKSQNDGSKNVTEARRIPIDPTEESFRIPRTIVKHLKRTF